MDKTRVEQDTIQVDVKIEIALTKLRMDGSKRIGPTKLYESKPAIVKLGRPKRYGVWGAIS